MGTEGCIFGFSFFVCVNSESTIPTNRPSTSFRPADSRASVARLHAAVKMLDINMLRPDKGGDPVRIDSRVALRSRFGSMDFSPRARVSGLFGG